MPIHFDWKSTVIGTLLTIILVVGLALAADRISMIWLKDWINQEMPKEDSTIEQTKQHIPEAMMRYFQQWHWVALNILFTTFGFGLGGYTTARLSKSRPLLHGGVVGVIVSLIVMSWSWFSPLFVFGSLSGAHFATRRARKA